MSICMPVPSVSELLAAASVAAPVPPRPAAAASKPPAAPASFARPQALAPASHGWTPSPELAKYTSLLNQANLDMVGHRTESLRRLQEFTVDGVDTTIDQLRTCGTIKTLPFLRMSKKVRENLLNREWVSAGRAFNRELLAAKIAAANRLAEISRDPQVPSMVQRLASAVNVRSSSGMKVEWGEINDGEIPEHLMPPQLEEAMWMAEMFPAGEVVARGIAPRGIAIPGDASVAATTPEAQTAKTPQRIAVSPVAAAHSNNKKNRFKKRRLTAWCITII